MLQCAHVHSTSRTKPLTLLLKGCVAMPKQESSREYEIQLKLTDEQRAEIVRLIGKAKTAKIEVDLIFEADLKGQTIAPTTVLVGNAI